MFLSHQMVRPHERQRYYASTTSQHQCPKIKIKCNVSHAGIAQRISSIATRLLQLINQTHKCNHLQIEVRPIGDQVDHVRIATSLYRSSADTSPAFMVNVPRSSSYRVRNGAHPSHSSTLHFCDVAFAWYLPEMMTARHDMVQVR